MTIIGVTGPTGSGKSLLCEYLSNHGISVIDADEVYHGLLIPPSPCLDALREAFGDGVFDENGTLSRKTLSAIVFHDEEKLALLNRTVLGFVLDRINEMIRELERTGHTHVVVDAPTLIESGFHRQCDLVISVISPASVRTERIMKRDGISSEQAKDRVLAQKKDEFYRDHSDHVLTNEGSPEDFIIKIKHLCEEIGLSLLPHTP